MRILNAHTDKILAGTRWVDRRTPLGNPFRIGRDGTREEVVRKYKAWFGKKIRTDRRFRVAVEGLRGTPALVCWCAPKACHAQVIVDYLERHRK
jgi:hypothetical protein